METALAVIFVLIAAAGLVVRRWSVLVVPVVAWPLIYGAIAAGLIGSGLGDSWVLGALAITAASVAATAVMTWLGRRSRSKRPSA